MRRRTKTPRPLSCRAVAKLIQAYLDGEIADPRGVLVANHLDDCRRCGMEAEAYRALIRSLRASATPDDHGQLARLEAFANALAS